MYQGSPMKHSRMLGLALPLAFAALCWPSTASGKQGAVFVPQLSAVPLGGAAQVQLYVSSVLRAGLPLLGGGRELIPAPVVGSVPVVRLRPLSGGHVLRFTGTPLDQHRHSVVWIRLPSAVGSQRWQVSVRAGGHVYPDLVDSSVNDASTAPTAPASEPAPIRPSPAPTGRPDRGSPAWAFVLGGLAIAAATGGALNRARRVGRQLPRGAGR